MFEYSQRNTYFADTVVNTYNIHGSCPNSKLDLRSKFDIVQT